MSTQRYISTSFWADKWIRSLSPSDRYLYMYLLTNPLTNIAGVYQITFDRIAFDTGYDERTLVPVLERFGKAKKAHFVFDEWIILPSWPKHQKWETKASIKKGIEDCINKIPAEVREYMVGVSYQYPMTRWVQGPTYLDLDLDSDTDTDTDTDTDINSHNSNVENFPQTQPEAGPASPGAGALVEKDPPAHQQLVDLFCKDETSRQLIFNQGKSTAGREMKSVKDILARCSNLAPGAAIELAREIVAAFYHLTHHGGINASFVPSQLNTTWIWLKVIEAMRKPASVDRQRIRDIAEGRIETNVY